MIKKLDWYIISKYLKTFFFVVLIFSLIAGVVDFSDKIDDFLEAKVSFWEVVSQYYFNFFPYINSLLWALYALIAVIFVTSRLSANSEIISVLNAGISFRRLMRPYLIAAGVLSAMHLLGANFLVPYGNARKTAFENRHIYSHNDQGKKSNVYFALNDSTNIGIRQYHTRDSSCSDVIIEGSSGGKISTIINITKMKWLGMPNRWQWVQYRVRSFEGLEETAFIGQKIDTVLNLQPGDFMNYDNAKESMTSPALLHYILRQKSRGVGNTQKYEIELWRRITEPVAIFILTIIGMTLAARKVRGGFGLHIALGIALGAIYILLFRFSTTFVTNGNLPAFVGVWIPTIIFGFICFYLVRTAQK